MAMKIILSRKGFDSKYGGCPSPIMPDNTLLSLPIPSDGDNHNYSEFVYKDLSGNCISYDRIIEQLAPSQRNLIREEYDDKCHIDPDIRKDIWLNAPLEWEPAFGQTDSAQGYLRKKVDPGDLFLFFGWFRKVEQIHGVYSFVPKAPDLHVIYGYLQVEKVIDPFDKGVNGYGWHPHASKKSREKKNNALYLAQEKLSFEESMPGFGVFKFSKNRVLTSEGRPRSIWKDIKELRPENLLSNRKNSAGSDCIYYKGIWQEIALKETIESEKWAISLFDEIR